MSCLANVHNPNTLSIYIVTLTAGETPGWCGSNMWASLKETWERKGGKGGGDERTVQPLVRERRGVLEREAPPMGGTHGKIRSDAWETLTLPTITARL